MDLKNISPGEQPPHDLYAVIEIARGGTVKYEMCKDSNALFVDRFLSTSMCYPCHYGFVPQTLGDDGDPVDVLVFAAEELHIGCVIRVRPVGVLIMEDEKGRDEKILAVPHSKLTTLYEHIQSCKDLPSSFIQSITHFFEHYKDLEPGKWVKISSWEDVSTAHGIIEKAIEQHKHHSTDVR